MPKDIEEIIVQPYMDAPPFPAPREVAPIEEPVLDDEEDSAE
jgi:hypothetical protein